MATLRLQSPVVIAVLILLFTLTTADNRSTEIRSESRSPIPIHQFGFTPFGRLHLNLSQISISPLEPSDLSRIGLFLCTPDTWSYVNDQIGCPLDSAAVKPVVTFNHLTTTSSYDAVFNVTDANRFTLFFVNCAGGNVKVSVNVISVMYNLNPKNDIRDYLSAGKSCLPKMYLLFFMIYVYVSELWGRKLRRWKPLTNRVQYLMSIVLFLKVFNLLRDFEIIWKDKTQIIDGMLSSTSASSFLKGITLFTIIVLIGIGWSILKPYLQNRDKKVLMIAIPLQVIANLGLVVINKTGSFGRDLYSLRRVLLLVDLVCCCAILFRIIWSIKNLREAAMTNRKTAVNLMKLKLFKRYYVIVMCYIYFTRISVYVLETITSYRYEWTSVLAAELATLAFYVFTGYTFRPKLHNPYFASSDEEEDAALEGLKLEEVGWF